MKKYKKSEKQKQKEKERNKQLKEKNKKIKIYRKLENTYKKLETLENKKIEAEQKKYKRGYNERKFKQKQIDKINKEIKKIDGRITALYRKAISERNEAFKKVGEIGKIKTTSVKGLTTSEKLAKLKTYYGMTEDRKISGITARNRMESVFAERVYYYEKYAKNELTDNDELYQEKIKELFENLKEISIYSQIKILYHTQEGQDFLDILKTSSNDWYKSMKMALNVLKVLKLIEKLKNYIEKIKEGKEDEIMYI